MKPRKILILVGALLGALVSSNAFANDGTTPFIHELIQSDNTNVQITLGIVDSGEPGINDAYRLERDGPDGVVDVIDDTTFIAEEAVETEDRCRGGWEDFKYCEENPGDCLDCDGDKILECNTYYDGWCETVYYFEVIDWCVPAGETDYLLYTTMYDFTQDEDTIVVEAWSEECEPPATDTDTDSDTDSDTDTDADSDSDSDSDDSDGGSDGCSVTGAGVKTNRSLVSVLLSFVS